MYLDDFKTYILYFLKIKTKNCIGFRISKMWRKFKHFTRTVYQAPSSYFWKVNTIIHTYGPKINFYMIFWKVYCTTIRNIKFFLMSLWLFWNLGRVFFFISLNFLFCCNEKLHFVSRLQAVQYVHSLLNYNYKRWARVQKHIFVNCKYR